MPENLPKHIQDVQEAARKFIAEDLVPLENSIEAGADEARLTEIRERVREKSKQLGLFYKTQPEDFGGNPASTLELTMLRELFAASNLTVTNNIFGPGPGILANAQGELKSLYLDPVIKGEKRGAFGFTEPDSAERPTWARREGDDLLITGCKSYVTGGDTADFIAVLVNVEQNDTEPGGTAMVVVDRNAEGLQIDRKFSSLDGSHHVSITLNEVRVSVSRVIGKLGEGMPRALSNIGNVRLMVAAQATGICMWVIDYVAEHLLAPHRSGTPLGQREGVRLRFADMRIDTFAARSMLYRTARLTDAGENIVNETIATKVFCTETAGRVVDMAVQLIGGQALVDGHPMERLYRVVRSLRLMEGASDLLRINLVKGCLELGKGRL
jgi:acyl-CoA dehydrogenase